MAFLIRMNGTVGMGTTAESSSSGTLPELQMVLQHCHVMFWRSSGEGRVVALPFVRLHSHTSAQSFLGVTMSSRVVLKS